MAKEKKPKAPKKPKPLSAWLIPKLRNIARMWPDKNKARAKAARRVEDGKFLNGKPKYKTMYECFECKRLFVKELTHMDHQQAVIDPEVGFVDWNTYIERLFCESDNFACLCLDHHSEKTKAEGQVRKVTRQIKKAKKV